MATFSLSEYHPLQFARVLDDGTLSEPITIPENALVELTFVHPKVVMIRLPEIKMAFECVPSWCFILGMIDPALLTYKDNRIRASDEPAP